MCISTFSVLKNFYMVVILIILSSVGCNVQAHNYWTTLFPSSSYSRALEVCMRVLDDTHQVYDVETAEDLCVGRLVRLFKEVSAIEYVHTTCNPYPPEDIEYMVSLMGKITQEKQAQINSSRPLASLVKSIQTKLCRLLS